MRHKDRATASKIEPMLTTAEVSRLLHVHPNTLRRWSDSGIIKTYRVGPRGDRRFSRDDITHFLASLEGNGGNPQTVDMVWR